MVSARLRRTFRYPEDDSGDDESTRKELDEEEQEVVIRRLHMQNDRRNSEYTIFFTLIPLLSAVFYVPSILTGPSVSESSLALLNVMSLVATACIMKYVPLERPYPNGKRPMREPDPLDQFCKFLPPMNIALCLLLAIVFVVGPQLGFSSSLPITSLVPGAILATILLARKLMVSVDLEHLEDLRYEYKGA